MYWRGAAALLFVTASYFDTISATLITVTEYPTTCKAVYTSGSQSVTVVQSTVTVSPAPWTDQDANRGMPFVLMVRPHSSMRKERRQPLSVYVMSNGQTTTTMSSAAVCMIENGTLSTMDDGWLSTKPGVTDHPFKFSSTQYPITKWFVVQSGVLHWQNDDFQNSPVKFFEIPADHPNGAQILIEFNPDSNIDSTLEQVDLVTYPYNQQSSGGSSGSSGNQGGSPSTSASASNGGGNQGGQSGQPSTSVSGGYGGQPSSTGPGASPTASSNVSPNGLCGGDGGFSCTGSGFGNCCSQYGFCGTGSMYCQPGCQPAFGICWSNGTIPTSGVAVSGSGSATMQLSMTQSSMTAGSPPPMPTFSCPADDMMTVADLDGVEYELGCGRDVTAGAYGSTAVRYSFDECFALCDMEPHCQAWTYSGGVNGIGAGTCFFRNDVAGFINHDPKMVGALRVSPPGRNFTSTSSMMSSASMLISSTPMAMSSTSTFTSAATPIGPINPGQSLTSMSSSVMMSSSGISSSPMASSSSSMASSSPMVSTTPSSSSMAMASSTPQMPSTTSRTSSSSMMTSSSSPAMSSTISTTSFSSTAASSTSSMGSSSSATSIPSSPQPVCPAMNGTAYYDTHGNEYQILCNTNTNPGAFASAAEPDFGSCINACAARTDGACVAVTFTGGNCFFKSQYYGDSSSVGTEAAVLASVLGVSPPTYSPSPTPSPTSTSMSSGTVTSMSGSTTQSPSSTSTGPYLYLTSPTPCSFGDPPGTDEDDSYCEIDLPFPMIMYGSSDTHTFASTNGLLSLTSGTAQYSAQTLPDSNIPNSTVAPFFDDLYLYGNSSPQQGIFYQFFENNTQVGYEYYLGRAGEATPLYHFFVGYDSLQPGIFVFWYFSTGGSSDNGIYAAVGTQGINGQGSEEGVTYAFQSQDITPGLQVKCNTLENTCVTLQS